MRLTPPRSGDDSCGGGARAMPDRPPAELPGTHLSVTSQPPLSEAVDDRVGPRSASYRGDSMISGSYWRSDCRIFLTMLAKTLALGLGLVLLVLTTDAFAMGDGRRRRGGGGNGNGNVAGAGATNHTLTDAQVAGLQATVDSAGSSDVSSGLAASSSNGVAHSPEPGSMLLLASGAAAVAGWRWRRNRAA